MSGSAENASLWLDADVYIAPKGTAGPDDLTTAWGAGWSVVGLLDGAEGFVEKRDSDKTEHYAWGGKLYKRSVSKHKRTIKFVALEDNDVVFDLVNPGSTRTSTGGVRKSTIKTPVAGEQFAIGFETREGAKSRRRVAAIAEVEDIGEIKASESDPTVYEVTVVIFPAADGTLYTDIETDSASA
jgi:hypothetical protein